MNKNNKYIKFDSNHFKCVIYKNIIRDCRMFYDLAELKLTLSVMIFGSHEIGLISVHYTSTAPLLAHTTTDTDYNYKLDRLKVLYDYAAAALLL